VPFRSGFRATQEIAFGNHSDQDAGGIDDRQSADSMLQH
jgi:hypothetical protein